MNLAYFIDRLSQHEGVFENLFTAVPQEQAGWKPASDKWSLLEVVNHLYDEERDDFRTRLDLLINHSGQAWPPIDPPRWAVEREYNKRDLNSSLHNFLNERGRSILWLKELPTPDWNVVYEHPSGPISAGDLLASWLAHDLIHIRQATRLHWEYLSEISKPFSTSYAGSW